MKIMEQIMNYVKPELLIVAVVLYFIGIGIKKSETISDKYIPAILGVETLKAQLGYDFFLEEVAIEVLGNTEHEDFVSFPFPFPRRFEMEALRYREPIGSIREHCFELFECHN